MKAINVSSLEKIFPSKAPHDAYNRASMLSNEMFAYQVAYYGEDVRTHFNTKVECVSPIADCITLRHVRLVPCEYPLTPTHDDYFITDQPGLFPDLLEPVGEPFHAIEKQWRAIWVTVEPKSPLAGGEYPIDIQFKNVQTDEVLAQTHFTLEVIAARLPQQDIIHTEWFHADCLADYYQVEVMSEAWWKRCEQFVRLAVERGINMILTPVLTPPLDTYVGGERTTVQLVDITIENGEYAFDFSNFVRWIQMCKRCGVQYIEINHMFTQWGAGHAPKVMASVDGKMQKIFGWETDSTGEPYKEFLRALIPQLIQVIREQGIADCTYFHVSDEPRLEQLETYKNVASFFKEMVKGFRVIDALSNVEYYLDGVVEHPVPATNHIEAFLEQHIPDLWAYYCVSQHVDVANRFLAMPSERCRVLGTQLYKFDIVGFLHWGYNFYNCQYSYRTIDPFRFTDAERAFPGGDAFLVYPGPEGPLASLRLEVHYAAFQDVGAFKLAETLVGKQKVLETIQAGIEPITFSKYPHSAAWLLSMRERINELIKANL